LDLAKHILALTCSLALTCACAHGQSTSGWQTVTADGGGFLATNNVPLTTLSIGDIVITNSITVSTNWGWEDLRFPIGTFLTKPVNNDLAVNEANNSITFETGCGTNLVTDDHIYGLAQMPHTWRVASPVSLHVHFEQDNADQTNMWWAYVRNQPLGGTILTTWTQIGPAVNMLTYTAGTLHQMAIFPDIVMTGMVESSIMDWKLFRDGTAGTGDIEMKEPDIHYQIATPTGEIF
jgi:hypothetical protein